MEDLQKLLLTQLQNTQNKSKGFSDMLRDRRDFVQRGEDTLWSQTRNSIKDGANGVPINPVAAVDDFLDFSTANSNKTAQLTQEAMGYDAQANDLIAQLAQLAMQQEDRALQREQLGMTQRQAGVKAETDLRAEFDKSLKESNLPTIKQYYDRLANADDSAAGDLTRIFSYMKLLDPTSVVREGEQASAQNAGGVPDQIRNLYNRSLNGQRLTPEQRADFLNNAGNIYNKTLDAVTNQVAYYNDLARQYGVDPNNVTRSAQNYKPIEVNRKTIQDFKSGNVFQNLFGNVFGGNTPLQPTTSGKFKIEEIK